MTIRPSVALFAAWLAACAGLAASATAQPSQRPQGALGLEVGRLSADDIKMLSLERPYAVKIAKVAAGSAAEAAGLRPGDFILSMDERYEKEPACFVDLVHAHEPGSTATLVILRQGERMSLEVTFTQVPTPPPPAAPAPDPSPQEAINAEFQRTTFRALRCFSKQIKAPAAARAVELAPAFTGWKDEETRIARMRELWHSRAMTLYFRQDWDVVTETRRDDDIDQSIAAYRNALTFIDVNTTKRQHASLYAGLAQSYGDKKTGDVADYRERAIEAYERALSILEPGDTRRPKLHLEVGKLYTRRIRGEIADNHERAISHLETALAGFPRSEKPDAWAMVQSNLGSVYLDRVNGDGQDNLAKALRYFTASETVNSFEAEPKNWANLQNSKAIALSRLRGDHNQHAQDAIDTYNLTFRVYSRERYPNSWALTHYNIARVLLSWHGALSDQKIDEAIVHLKGAIEVIGPGTYPRLRGLILNNLGAAMNERRTGNRSENVVSAIAVLEGLLSEADYTRDATGNFLTHVALGSLYAEQQNWSRAEQYLAVARTSARELLAENTDTLGARKTIESAALVFSRSAFVAAAQGDGVRALAFSEEGRARGIAAALDAQSGRLTDAARRRIRDAKLELADLQAQMDAIDVAGREATIKTIASLRQEISSLVGSASQSDDAQRGRDLLASARLIDAAVVIPITSKFGGKALVLNDPAAPGQIRILDWPGFTETAIRKLLPRESDGRSGWLAAYDKNSELDRLAFRLQSLASAGQFGSAEALALRQTFQTVDAEWRGAIAAIGPDLWTLIGRGMAEAVRPKTHGERLRLVWIPSNGLGLLPVGLAAEHASARRLGDTYDISTAPSLKSLIEASTALAAQRRNPSRATFAGIANPNGDLPFTETEVALASSHFDPKSRFLLVGPDASVDRVIASIRGRRYWHFSSHGFYDWEAPDRSGLVLAGKTQLSVPQMQALGGMDQPRLVVLSACETGIYELNRTPEEFVGLPGAVISIGAIGVVSTLWRVDDRATALLIAKFYELHIGARLPPATALARAQEWLRTATRPQLVAFARRSTNGGAMGVAQLRALEDTFTRSGTQVRFGVSMPDAAASARSRISADASQPFAHPYYWAAFVLTGL